jgi:hypothetical protein
MGYRHWQLLKGDDYQRAVARMRVAELLDAHAKGIGGPLALSCEAPVDGWDDIVEYGAAKGQLTATHYQVKLQNTDFKAGEKTATFEDLFKHAAKILADADPYEGVTILPVDRYFRFVLPTDEITVGATLGIDQLRMLLEECEGTAADAIVANKGVNLKGADKGKQKRDWLALIRAAVGTDDECAILLRQMQVELRPVATLEGNGALAALFENPGLARDLVDKAIRDTAPEGWLDAEELLPKLFDAKPKPAMRQVLIAQHEGRFYAQPHARVQEVRAVADAIVAKVWAAHAAADLHVSFPLPDGTASDGARALRLACIRLLLHARQSPVRLTGHMRWFERTRLEVARVLGVTGPTDPLAEGHFNERPAPGSLPPKISWSPEDLAGALHAAMDARVWELVRGEGTKVMVGAKGVPFDELVAFLMGVDGFLERVLRGWWGLEQAASGVARAGPAIASNVAWIVAGLAVFRYAGFGISRSPDHPDVAKVGALPVRALALDQAAINYDGEPQAVGLSRHARQILELPGLVLIVRGDVNRYYTLARLRHINEPAAGANLQTASPSAFLMCSESLVDAAGAGADIATQLIRECCDTLANHHIAALDAALQQWRESNAA